MARNLRERMTRQAERATGQMNQTAEAAIDKAADAIKHTPEALKAFPRAAKETAQNIPEHLKNKADLLMRNVEAKQMLEDRLLDREDYREKEFLERLATDPQMRKTVERILEPALNPTPVTADPLFQENGYINIGAGLSTFWNAMQEKTEIELDELEQLDNILMGIEAGLDKDMEPDTRKSMLAAVGFDQEQIDRLVPLSEYAEYEERIKDVMRAQVAEEMDLDPETDGDLINDIVEDKIMNAKLAVDPEDLEGPDYEETYGYSMQEIYEMFSEEPAPEEMPQDAPIDDTDWARYMEAPLEELEDIYNASPEENYQAYLDTMAAFEEEQRGDLDLRPEDFSFAEEPPQFGITEDDLAFAEHWQEEDQGMGNY